MVVASRAPTPPSPLLLTPSQFPQGASSGLWTGLAPSHIRHSGNDFTLTISLTLIHPQGQSLNISSSGNPSKILLSLNFSTLSPPSKLDPTLGIPSIFFIPCCHQNYIVIFAHGYFSHVCLVHDLANSRCSVNIWWMDGWIDEKYYAPKCHFCSQQVGTDF